MIDIISIIYVHIYYFNNSCAYFYLFILHKNIVWVDPSVYEQAEKLLRDETDAEAVKRKYIDIFILYQRFNINCIIYIVSLNFLLCFFFLSRGADASRKRFW